MISVFMVNSIRHEGGECNADLPQRGRMAVLLGSLIRNHNHNRNRNRNLALSMHAIIHYRQ